jgi:hypothetical protein
VKELSYATTGRILGDVPDRYETTSPLCILANRPTRHEDIQSRATTLFHDPTNLEVHRAVARWYWDQEVHNWFGQHLYRLAPIETRWYLTAHWDKEARRDWRRIMLTAHSLNRPASIVQDLEVDGNFPTREDKARAFEEMMGDARGASRATYFRLRTRLEEEDRLIAQTVSPMRLRRTRAPGTPSLLELDAMGAALPEEIGDEPQALDVPAREEFTQPIRGNAPPQPPPVRIILDDTMPWERPAGQDEGDEE